MTLSLACMMNAAEPRARHGNTILGLTSKFFNLMRSKVFLPHKKETTHTQDKAWEITVASAAPRTPISNPYMKIGSKMILATAPMITESMDILVKPCAVTKAFIPSVT